jgi:DNA primase
MIDEHSIKRNYPLSEIFERITGKKLKRAGRDHKAVCVFHTEKNASLTIFSKDNRYYCYGCKATGNNIDFVMNYLNTDFKTAIEIITGITQAREPKHSETPLNSEIKRAEITEVTKAIYQFFFDNIGITPQGRNYLYSRGFNDYVIEQFKMKSIDDPQEIKELLLKNFSINDLRLSGLFTSNKRFPFVYSQPCVVFPIFNNNREPVYFSNRNINKNCETRFYNLSIEKKYFNGNLDQVNVYIFESYIDAISFYQLTNNDCFIVSCGLLSDPNYTDLLREYPEKHFIIAYDNDNTGNERTNALLKVDPERSAKFDYNKFINEIELKKVDQFKDFNDLLILHTQQENERLYNEKE